MHVRMLPVKVLKHMSAQDKIVKFDLKFML